MLSLAQNVVIKMSSNSSSCIRWISVQKEASAAKALKKILNLKYLLQCYGGCEHW